MKDISLKTYVAPTNTFQLSKYKGLGLKREMAQPDTRKPVIMAKIEIGAERSKQFVFLSKRLHTIV